MEGKQEVTNPSPAPKELENNLLSKHKIHVSYQKKPQKTPTKPKQQTSNLYHSSPMPLQCEGTEQKHVCKIDV